MWSNFAGTLLRISKETFKITWNNIVVKKTYAYDKIIINYKFLIVTDAMKIYQ